MAAIVFVHGIGQELRSTKDLESEWRTHLAVGVRRAGFANLADGIWHPDRGSGPVTASMAYYANCFPSADLHGRPISNGVRLAQKKRRNASPNRGESSSTLGRIDRPAFRRALAALLEVPGIASLSMSLAERFVEPSLSQVTRYFRCELTRRFAIGAVMDHVDSSTRIMIGHSLGGIVAYEAAHIMSHDIRTLITLAAPFSLPGVVHPKLRPRPLSRPKRVGRWLNLSNRDDFLSRWSDFEKHNGTEFALCRPSERSATSPEVAHAHQALEFLRGPEVGTAVATALLEQRVSG